WCPASRGGVFRQRELEQGHGGSGGPQGRFRGPLRHAHLQGRGRRFQGRGRRKAAGAESGGGRVPQVRLRALQGGKRQGRHTGRDARLRAGGRGRGQRPVLDQGAQQSAFVSR